jgi:hypothetical protein
MPRARRCAIVSTLTPGLCATSAIQPLAGTPLFHHILATLSGCPSLHEVWLVTDSQTVRRSARACFPHVRLLDHDPPDLESEWVLRIGIDYPMISRDTIEVTLETAHAVSRNRGGVEALAPDGSACFRWTQPDHADKPLMLYPIDPLEAIPFDAATIPVMLSKPLAA